MDKRSAGRREFLAALAVSGAAASSPLAGFAQAVDSAPKASGYKSHSAEGKKPYSRTKPAAPRTDARDTSKRFVPPKKPKS